jgi:hypothetical protein
VFLDQIILSANFVKNCLPASIFGPWGDKRERAGLENTLFRGPLDRCVQTGYWKRKAGAT